MKGKSYLGIGIFLLLLLVVGLIGVNYLAPGTIPGPGPPPQDCEYSPNHINFL